ncbi:MAG: hypothetical protein FJ317_03440 [SAR202 cluster bacterium]|nr:hypothetical protein [SAR202 cluster bacterium]
MGLLGVVPLRAGGRIRWAARILGLLVVLFVLAWDIGGIVAIVTEGSVDSQEVVEAVVLSLAAATLLAAWRWEKLGGLLGVLWGVALGIVTLFTVGPDRKVYLLLVSALPLIVIGGAFLVADGRLRLSRRKPQG